MSKKKNSKVVIKNCTFTDEPPDAETLATVRAVAEAVKQNAIALDRAVKALANDRPMLTVDGRMDVY